MNSRHDVKPCSIPVLHPRILFGFATLTMLQLPTPAAAFDPTITKLHARNTVAQVQPNFGSSVAVSEKWILVGEPSNDDLAQNAGAVHVFNAITGTYVRKLRAADGAAFDVFGSSVAVNGNMALIGAPRDDDPVAGIDAGSAYAFNLLTGVQVRKLKASDAAASDLFGSAVALSGNRALVGANFADGVVSDSGAAYVFNISTGVQQTKLQAVDGAPNDLFGASVALSGGFALVGAPVGNGGVANSGSAYLFDATATGATTDWLVELNASDGAVSDGFGTSVALSGNLAVVGAILGNGAVADSGSAYVFDVTESGILIEEQVELNAVGGLLNDNFGSTVALNGNLALVGAQFANGPVADSGAAYLFDVTSETQLRKLTAPDGALNDNFGICAMCGDVAVIGAWQADIILGDDTGAAYVFRPLAGPFHLTKATALKDFAPGTVEASFLAFGDAFLNVDAEVIFTATLIGAGAPVTKNQGVWDSLAINQLDLLLRKGDAAPESPGVVSGLYQPIANRDNFAIFEATFSGSGVTTANNRALLADDGTPPLIQLLRLEETPFGGGEKVSRFLQVAQSRFDAGTQQAVAVQLAARTGSPAVTAASDTGILCLGGLGGVLKALREGEESTATGLPVYGQFSRVSYHDFEMVFACGIQSSPTDNQGVFRATSGGAETLVKRKGEAAPGTGAFFSSFSGETTSTGEEAVFRATLSGPGVTTANDTGLWSEHTGPVTLVAREDDSLPVSLGFPATVRWAQFMNFWAIDTTSDQVLFLARIKGPGITAANDVGLWLLDGASSYQLLLREGDVAPHCATGSIGTIQMVAAVPETGHYAVLATLVNSALTTNQALFTGNTELGAVESPFRRAFLKLRKGTLYQSPQGATTTIKSLSLPASAFDATGAGAKGLGQPINRFGEMVLPILFNNGIKELMTGVP
jgi:hypothetical protein